ncbi:unnamed protein product [Rotaria sp. Silwood1]|nr:unnamed protein product [Rotaria sp. Silwood1]
MELELVCRSITNQTEPDVVGVVGPSSSTNARYLGPFAARIGLPLVSYAATNADLDDTFTYQTFYRTIPSDTLLAHAVVQLFKYFSWTTCTIIIGKDDYGYGALKILSELYYSNLSLQERLIFDPRFDQFHAHLKPTLERSRSRIVLVWANQSSTTRIIQHALKAELLGGNYVWVTTNKIDFNVFIQNDWFKLKGILTVVPTIGNSSIFGVNETLQKEAFDTWRKLSNDDTQVPKHLSAVSPFAMYTFDAVWAMIQALNKSTLDKKSPSMQKSSTCFDSLLQNHTEYLMYLNQTLFFGVSGIIHFSKDNLHERTHGTMYTLYNVQDTEQKSDKVRRVPNYKQIMTWYEISHNWMNYSDQDNINIIWPNNQSEKVPTDYPQLRGLEKVN